VGRDFENLLEQLFNILTETTQEEEND